MAHITIGEVDWETAELPGERTGISDFMVLEQGDNKGRVLSNPQQFAVHWVVDETGKKRKVNCATDGCPVCQRGQDTDKPQVRWLIKFLNRKGGKVQLLEISSQIMKGIITLVQDPEWGAVTEYDINVKRGIPGSQPLYNVIPGRRSPLTTEEKQSLLAFNDRVDISRFVTPPLPSVVAEKLGWSNVQSSNKSVSNDFRTGVKQGVNSPGKSQVTTNKPKIDFDFDQ